MLEQAPYHQLPELEGSEGGNYNHQKTKEKAIIVFESETKKKFAKKNVR